MNKKELVGLMAEKSELSKKDAEKALVAFVESVKETLENGEKVGLVGFGTFEPKERAEREGVNPRTKERMTIPAKVVPTFKASKEFKEVVNK